jgi:hypothetical protein
MSDTSPEVPTIPETPDFAAFLAADLPEETIEFTVRGEPCSVTLKPFDHTTRDRFERLAIQQERAFHSGTGEVDPGKLKAFLIENTVIGWCIRTRKPVLNSPGEYVTEESRLSLDPGRRKQELAAMRAVPAAWDWLFEQCNRINGFGEKDAKNSPAPSDD